MRFLRESPVCPVCDGPCSEPFHRGDYRIGDPMPDHPPSIVAPDDVWDDTILRYQKGQSVPWSEAVRLGIVEPDHPDENRRGRRSGARARKGPDEHRAHLAPEEDRGGGG